MPREKPSKLNLTKNSTLGVLGCSAKSRDTFAFDGQFGGEAGFDPPSKHLILGEDRAPG